MKKFAIIYADPPWSFYNDSDALPDCTTVKGMRRPPYPVMSSQSILSAENALLFIWTTDYHLERCIGVINAWGFTYKTVGFVWAKQNKQGNQVCFMGAYTMKRGVELCLLGTKGKLAHKLVKSHKVKSYIASPRQKHSKKPDEIRNRIVSLCGDVSRLELFAGRKIEGWNCIGYEVDGMDIRQSIEKLKN